MHIPLLQGRTQPMERRLMLTQARKHERKIIKPLAAVNTSRSFTTEDTEDAEVCFALSS
jgi:hypothetical protein